MKTAQNWNEYYKTSVELYEALGLRVQVNSAQAAIMEEHNIRLEGRAFSMVPQNLNYIVVED